MARRSSLCAASSPKSATPSAEIGHDRVSHESRLRFHAEAGPRAGLPQDPRENVTVEATTDVEAIETATSVAKAEMEFPAYPETIDTDERRHGVISYIAKFASGTRKAVAEVAPFDIGRVDTSP